jgi:hypothetical protein
LKDWRIEGLEDWRIGGLEDWRIGGLEDWISKCVNLKIWRYGNGKDRFQS